MLLVLFWLAAVAQVAFVFQFGYQETRGGSWQFGADAPNVFSGSLVNRPWFYFLEFCYFVSPGGDDDYLVAQTPLLQEDCCEGDSYADDFCGGVTVFLGKGEHVFS